MQIKIYTEKTKIPILFKKGKIFYQNGLSSGINAKENVGINAKENVAKRATKITKKERDKKSILMSG